MIRLYDDFCDYDRFINWERRLAHELPFIERQLTSSGVERVLDVACGTGKHAIALAQHGYKVVGTDLSAGMIERARENTAAERVQARFVVAGFGGLVPEVGTGFDALLCMGNSLPHVLTTEALRATLADFAAVLEPGGLLLIQNRNFDAVMAGCVRWMTPRTHREGKHEWLFLRFYDFNQDGTLTFNVVTLQHDATERWTQRTQETTLRPWLHDELTSAVTAAGFGPVVCYGDVTGAPFDAESSGNLIVVAQRTVRTP